MWRIQGKTRKALAIHFIIHFLFYFVIIWYVFNLLKISDPISITAICFLLSLISIVIEWLMSPFLIANILKPSWLKREDEPFLWTLIENESECAEINISKVGIIDEEAPNVLVIPNIKGQINLVFTRGSLSYLSYREMKIIVSWMFGVAMSGFMGISTMFAGLLSLFYGVLGDFIKNRVENGDQKISYKIFFALIYIPFVLTLPQYVSSTRLMTSKSDMHTLEKTKDPAGLLTALLKVTVGISLNPRGMSRSKFIPVKGLMFIDPTLALRNSDTMLKTAQSFGIDMTKLLGVHKNKLDFKVNDFHLFERFYCQSNPVERFSQIINDGKSIQSPIKIGFSWIE